MFCVKPTIWNYKYFWCVWGEKSTFYFLYIRLQKCPLHQAYNLYFSYFFAKISEKVEVSYCSGRFTSSVLFKFTLSIWRFFCWMQIYYHYFFNIFKIVIYYWQKDILPIHYVLLYSSLIIPFALMSILFDIDIAIPVMFRLIFTDLFFLLFTINFTCT